MRLLLDSHVLIWSVEQDHLLSSTAHAAITDPSNDLLVSAATIWEIAIKVSTGKMSLSFPYRQWMNQAIADLRLTVLPITIDYADAQAKLPHISPRSIRPSPHRPSSDRGHRGRQCGRGIRRLWGDAVVVELG